MFKTKEGHSHHVGGHLFLLYLRFLFMLLKKIKAILAYRYIHLSQLNV